jgi:hypothetical protein
MISPLIEDAPGFLREFRLFNGLAIQEYAKERSGAIFSSAVIML